MYKETNGGWLKHKNSPVLGGELGTCFDIAVLKEDNLFRMYFSWRPKMSVAIVESKDGIHWSEPVIVVGPRSETGWEEEINRPVVLKKEGKYLMWYTGQVKPGDADGNSWIGYAESQDSLHWINLYLASMAQIYPEDRGQNYAIRSGIEIAQIISKSNKL